MRQLFFFLLVINVAYLLWHLGVNDENEKMVGSIVEGIPPVYLLSERSQSNGSQDLKNNEKQSGDEVSELGAPESQRLIQSEENVKPAETPTSEVLSVEGGEKPENNCFTVGPLKSIESIRNLVRDLRNDVTDTKIREQEEKNLSVYWVYIGPEKSRKDAKNVGQKLKAKQIKDFYVIRSGEKNNGISLGHFKNKYRATKLAKRVESLGFTVNVEPVFKTHSIYWLNYQVAGTNEVSETLFKKYETSAVDNQITLIKRNCR